MIEFQRESSADFFAKDINVQNADPSDIFFTALKINGLFLVSIYMNRIFSIRSALRK